MSNSYIGKMKIKLLVPASLLLFCYNERLFLCFRVGMPQRSYLSFVLILGGLTVLGIASMDLYLPAIAMIAEDFNTSQATIQLSVSLFVLVLGIGQFFLGPLDSIELPS